MIRLTLQILRKLRAGNWQQKHIFKAWPVGHRLRPVVTACYSVHFINGWPLNKIATALESNLQTLKSSMVFRLLQELSRSCGSR